MSDYLVTTTPTQLQLGYQGTVTIVNNGPSTVYLDNSSSVNTQNSFVLRPLSTMTWQPNNQLWAVAASGEARLNVNLAGYLSDQNRASVQRLILATDQTTTTAFEVGSYETLLLRYQYTNAVGGKRADAQFTFTWYDEAGSPIFEETVETWLQDIVIGSINIPVKGAICVVSSVVSAALNSLKIYGSTRRIPMQASNYLPTYVYSGACTPDAHRGIIQIPDYDYELVWLPQWGNQLRVSIYVAGTVTVAGELSIGSITGSYNYGSITIPTGTDLKTEATFYVPNSVPLQLSATAPTPASGLAAVTLDWIDYD